MNLPKELPVSHPSTLARQRPDIQAAEALLHAASAGVGVATANLYPQINLTADTNLRTVDEFRRLVVRQHNGTIVRLGDIADVVLGAEDYDSDVRYSGQTAVWMGIWPLPNANSLDVIKSVHSKMESIKKELPVGLDARVAYDATEYISHAISEVVKTLGDTLLIVVIFLFLGSFRSVLVPVVAISRWNSSWPRRPNPGRSWKSPKRCRKRR